MKNTIADVFDQDTHRGVIDRALAKEVSITPGLRCVGVMTAGDFFAPESMLGKRKGRKPRTLASGSYRIRSTVYVVYEVSFVERDTQCI